MTVSNPILATNINKSLIKNIGDTIMKTYNLEYVKEAMEGCVNNDYKLICRAGRLLEGFARGNSIGCKANMKLYYITSLYRKFMRAYTRYIIANPNCIESISKDCIFDAMANGESIGINEP